jgi:hypothetical protein
MTQKGLLLSANQLTSTYEVMFFQVFEFLRKYDDESYQKSDYFRHIAN